MSAKRRRSNLNNIHHSSLAIRYLFHVSLYNRDPFCSHIQVNIYNEVCVCVLCVEGQCSPALNGRLWFFSHMWIHMWVRRTCIEDIIFIESVERSKMRANTIECRFGLLHNFIIKWKRYFGAISKLY